MKKYAWSDRTIIPNMMQTFSLKAEYKKSLNHEMFATVIYKQILFGSNVCLIYSPKHDVNPLIQFYPKYKAKSLDHMKMQIL